VVQNVDGHDPVAIDAAIASAIAETEHPSLICCKTLIGRGAPTK
jgi:transketolase